MKELTKNQLSILNIHTNIETRESLKRYQYFYDLLISKVSSEIIKNINPNKSYLPKNIK